MVDATRLASLLQRVDAEVRALRRLLAGEDLDDDALAATKYRVVVAFEASADAARHVIASEGLRVPRTYGDAFAVLADEGLIGPDLAMRLARAAGLRNLLVHQYADVDDERVLRDVRAGLGDLDSLVAGLAGLARG